MKRSNDMNKTLIKGLLAGALTLAASTAGAVDYYLAAKAYDKPLPDGTTVPMWGYVLDPDTDASGAGDCWEAAGGAAGRLACVDALPVPSAPGPRIWVSDDGTDTGNPVTALRVYLTNGLSEPTSFMITGQELPFSSTNPNVIGPVWDDGSHGGRDGNLTKRVRSFVAEANPNGGRRIYVWNNNRATPFVKSGSFVYHSGTLPQKQVYMGLYGAVTKDSAVGEAYPGVPYDQEQVLYYGEIDPDLNNAIANNVLDTAIHYHARWFLINGEPYSTACTDDGAGFDVLSGYPCGSMSQTADLPGVPAQSRTLLRFFSAAGETHVPTLQGMHMQIHAEDGNQYNWQTGATVAGMAPREQYSLILPPLKTKDAIIEPQLAGRYAIYDGNGYMTNPTSPEDINHGDTVGGMLRFLNVTGGVNAAPVAVADTAAVVEGRTITIDVLANDTDAEGEALAINSVLAATAGAVTCDLGVLGGTCDYTAAGAGTATFDYDAVDASGNVGNMATVTVTVAANAIPLANADSAAGDITAPIIIDVLANDSDGNGDALTVISTTVAEAVINADNTITYTPVATGPQTFDYTVADPSGATASATVSVDVAAAPGNRAPVAADDSYSIGEASILTGNVLANDTDPDGDALTASIGTGPANAAAFTLNPDGSFSYRSTPDFNGLDSFTYTANDGLLDSNVATVTIDVTAVNDVPVANDDTFILTSMEANSFAAPGMLGNDTDPDGDNLNVAPGTAVASAGTLSVNENNGSFSYTPEGGLANLTLGTVATISYSATDGLSTSNTATVTLTRSIVARQAICEFQNRRCDWVIQGNDSLPAGSTVRAQRGNRLIGTGTTDGTGEWTINVPNSRITPQTGATIDITVDEDPTAQVQDYPIVRQ